MAGPIRCLLLGQVMLRAGRNENRKLSIEMAGNISGEYDLGTHPGKSATGSLHINLSFWTSKVKARLWDPIFTPFYWKYCADVMLIVKFGYVRSNHAVNAFLELKQMLRNEINFSSVSSREFITLYLRSAYFCQIDVLKPSHFLNLLIFVEKLWIHHLKVQFFYVFIYYQDGSKKCMILQKPGIINFTRNQMKNNLAAIFDSISFTIGQV